MTASANIAEVFSGIQGEGLAVGRRQIFVRFAGCNLACEYCDTPEARQPGPFAHVESRLAEGGQRCFERFKNPMLAPDLAKSIANLDAAGLHDSVSLTGGEPLLSAGFIAELIPLCEGRRFYLETNGTLPRELRTVIELVHTVAMDIKLASASCQPIDLDVSREFLAIAFLGRSMGTACLPAVAGCAPAFVKVVVAARTTESELMEAVQVVASVGREIPLVIQPVTPVSGGIEPPSPERLLGLQMRALGVLADVRVIPQVHKLMGQK